MTAPPSAVNTIQTGILEIKIAQVQAFGSFWGDVSLSSFKQSNLKDLWEKLLLSTLFYKSSGNVNNPSEKKMKSIKILIKVEPYHTISFNTVNMTTLVPNQLVSIPIYLTNIGNYKDTIRFIIKNSKKSSLTSTQPVDVTLSPGENKSTVFAVGAFPYLWDQGTIHELKIQAYSIYQPDNILAERTIVIKTQGIYVSQQHYIFFAIFVVLLMAIGIALNHFDYKIYLKKREKKLFKKRVVEDDEAMV